MFRIDGDYALSHLLLSHKDDEHAGRILIGLEVNNADQYDTAVRPFFPTHGSGGVLRFTVSDIQRRKEPVNSSSSNSAPFASDEPPLEELVTTPPSPMRTDNVGHERLSRAHSFYAHGYRHGGRHHHHDRGSHHGSRGMHRNEESRRRSMGSFPPALPVPPVHFPLPIPGSFPVGPWNSGDRPLPPPPVGTAPHSGNAWTRHAVHPFSGPPPQPHPPLAQQPETENQCGFDTSPLPPFAAVSNEPLSPTASNPGTAVKDEIKGLIDGFVTHLNATLTRNGINELTVVDATSSSNSTACEPEPGVALGQDGETALDTLHPGVICDHCNKPVQGIRYKVSAISRK